MINLKAISPDNLSEIRSLVNLFDKYSTYAGLTPDQETFFSQKITSRFTSILIRAGKETIGHIAIRSDKKYPGEAQIILPLLIPEAAKHIKQIGIQLEQLFTSLSKRQNWNSLACLIPLSQIHVQEFLVSYFDAPVFGLCPAFMGSKNSSDPRHTGALFSHQFQRVTDVRNVFVPSLHKEICNYLLNAYCPQIKVLEEQDVTAEHLRISADRKAIERLSFPKTGITHSFITPSLVHDQKQFIQKLTKVDSPAHFVLIDMEDTKCPELALDLEANEYRFCGIAPSIRKRTSMIYSRCPKHLSSLDSCHAPRAQILAHYINSYDLGSSLDAVVLPPYTEVTSKLKTNFQVTSR